ncbi:MAG: hypothetical protein HY040_04775 [Planctomycetes bacterium]|nr:hypothetical protein [Planctomycetota bacterium]
MDSLNWHSTAALGSATLLLGLVLVSRRQRRQPSAMVALVTQRRSLRAQLVKLLGSDEAAQAAAQDEARRLNVSSASLEALTAAVERAAKEWERRQTA